MRDYRPLKPQLPGYLTFTGRYQRYIGFLGLRFDKTSAPPRERQERLTFRQELWGESPRHGVQQNQQPWGWNQDSTESSGKSLEGHQDLGSIYHWLGPAKEPTFGCVGGGIQACQGFRLSLENSCLP